MRTVSKMGLAGLRLGYLAGPDFWLNEIDKTRLPYNINVLTQVSTEFALRHKAVFDQQTQMIREERGRLHQSLLELNGVTPYPSEANFILLRCLNKPAPELFEELKTKGVLVKNLHGAHPILDQCLRITVGTAQENSAFIQALRKAL